MNDTCDEVDWEYVGGKLASVEGIFSNNQHLAALLIIMLHVYT